MVNKLSFVLSMSSKCKLSLLSIFRVFKLMESCGVESVYYEEMLVKVFQPLRPQLQQKTNHQTTKSCSTKQCLCTKLSVES
jgi:hypothetical protein